METMKLSESARNKHIKGREQYELGWGFADAATEVNWVRGEESAQGPKQGHLTHDDPPGKSRREAKTKEDLFIYKNMHRTRGGCVD